MSHENLFEDRHFRAGRVLAGGLCVNAAGTEHCRKLHTVQVTGSVLTGTESCSMDVDVIRQVGSE
jgi:hypothetical protein